MPYKTNIEIVEEFDEKFKLRHQVNFDGIKSHIFALRSADREAIMEYMDKLKKRKKYVKNDGKVVWVVQNTRYTQACSDILQYMEGLGN